MYSVIFYNINIGKNKKECYRYCSSLVGTSSLHLKVHPEKKRNQKNSTVSDRESNHLPYPVEIFLIAVFFGMNFFMQTTTS
jgi:hypothetical protein